MTISDWISLSALALSALAYWNVKNTSKRQNDLSDREIELVRIQLSKSAEEHRKSKQALVSARMYKVEKSNWRIRIFNSGLSEAKNVRLILDDQNQMVSKSMITGKFPMAKLESGHSVDIAAIVHMQTPPKEKLLIRWDDESGNNRDNTIEITI